MQKGQTLIEVLVAFGVAVTIVTAITTTVLFALSNTQFSKNQHLATQYAQDGMEILRQKRNRGETLFSQETKCFPIGGTDLTNKTGLNCPQSGSIPFLREVSVQDNASPCDDSQRIAVSVFWSDNKCTNQSDLYCHNVDLVSCLSDFMRVPTPNSISVAPTPSPTPYLAPALSTPIYSSGNINLNWTSVDGATSYTVFGCSGSTCSPTAVYYSGLTGTTWSHNVGFTCGQYYNYAVQAVFPGGGVSPKSPASPGNTGDCGCGDACGGG